jgi:hypothetical protein
LGKIENKLGVRRGRPPKRNIGGGLAHHGERRAGANRERHDSGKRSHQSGHASPLAMFYLGTSLAQFHQALRKTNAWDMNVVRSRRRSAQSSDYQLPSWP